MDSKSLTKTSFCDKEIDNVTNNDMKKYILDNLNTKSGLSVHNLGIIDSLIYILMNG